MTARFQSLTPGARLSDRVADALASEIREGRIAALAKAVKAGGEGVAEDVAFHRSIADAAHNPFLLDTLQYLSQYLMGATRVTRANEARRVDFARER